MPLTTIHRSRCSLSRGDWTVMIWTEYGFEPAAAQDFVSPAGFRHWRGDAEPVVVKVPPGELRRDAETAHWMAERGLDGFRLATREEAEFDSRAKGLLAEHAEMKGPQDLAGWNVKASALMVFEACRRIGEDDMAKRRKDDGPVLFGDLTDCGETAHRPDDRPARAELTPAIDGGSLRLGRIREAIRAETAAEAHRPDEKLTRTRGLTGAADSGEFVNPCDGDRIGHLEDAIRRALAQLHAALEGDEMARTATARAILEGALDGTERRVSA